MHRHLSEFERNVGERIETDHRHEVNRAARDFARHWPRAEVVRVRLLCAIVIAPGVVGAAGELYELPSDVAGLAVAGGQAEFLD